MSVFEQINKQKKKKASVKKNFFLERESHIKDLRLRYFPSAVAYTGVINRCEKKNKDVDKEKYKRVQVFER